MHLSQASPDVFRTTIDSIMWAFKHTERNISELGLSILKELLLNIRARTVQMQPLPATRAPWPARSSCVVLTERAPDAVAACADGTEIAQSFYQQFFISVLRDVFAVLTDTLHKVSSHGIARSGCHALSHVHSSISHSVVVLCRPASDCSRRFSTCCSHASAAVKWRCRFSTRSVPTVL
jgi:hypothetical protein